MQNNNNTNLGGFVGVGVIAIMLILLGLIIPEPSWKWGFLLSGIGTICALIAGAVFRSSTIVGVAFGIGAVVLFGIALRSFSIAINPTQQTLIPTSIIPWQL
jgi:hypothetical protein